MSTCFSSYDDAVEYFLGAQDAKTELTAASDDILAERLENA